MKILDDDGNELPSATPRHRLHEAHGGLRLQGRDDKTAANRHGDYFTVGDMGEIDEDGYLYLRDRKIDMIISGGVNIYPAEVEGALLSHPAVGDVAVFGIPHEDWGEEVKAVVEPSTRTTSPVPDLADELIEHCSDVARRVQVPADRSTSSTRCRATPTGSSTSERCVIRTGSGARGGVARGRDDGQGADRGGFLRHSRRSRRAATSAGQPLPGVRRGVLPPTAGVRPVPARGNRGRRAVDPGPALDLDVLPRAAVREVRTPRCRGYGVGQVDLPEGPRIQAILMGGPDDFAIGMEMEIDLETLRTKDDGDEVVIYRFRPVGAASER